MVDDSFKHLSPRRISYYPGAVLDVVVSEPEQTLGVVSKPAPVSAIESSGAVVVYRDPLRDLKERFMAIAAAESSNASAVNFAQAHISGQDGAVSILHPQPVGSIQVMDKTLGSHSMALVTQPFLQDFGQLVKRSPQSVVGRVSNQLVKSGFDLIKNNKKYNPIVQLMCNGHLESMEICSFKDFYQRISKFPVMMTSRLQDLQIHSTFSPKDKAQKSALKFILKHSPHLTELKIATNDLHGAFDFLTTQALRFPNLEVVSWKNLGVTVKMTLSQGEPLQVEMTVSCLDDISQDAQKLIQQGCLTKFGTHHIAKDTTDSHMVDILRSNPGLAHVELRIYPSLSTTAMELVTAARKTLVMAKASSSTGWGALNISIDWQDVEDIKSGGMVKISLDFPENSASPMTELWMLDEMTPEMIGHLLDLIHSYGWSIERLETNSSFTDGLAVVLDNSTLAKGSKIRTLRLHPLSLSIAGLECMDRVLGRSHNMDELHVNFSNLEDRAEREKAMHLLNRHSKLIQSISILGKSMNKWLTEISAMCSTRNEMPELVSFDLSSSDNSVISEECVQWIARMVSAPETIHQQYLIPYPNQASIQAEEESLAECTVNYPWEPLFNVALHHVQLRPEGWQTVIKALDFSYLGVIKVDYTDFSLAELRFLIDCIPDNVNPRDTLMIFAQDTDASRSSDTDTDTVRELIKLLREKIPHARIFPLDSVMEGEAS
ncbi:MAG: hypothetical protein J3Q66DRAFT_410669 [Benniella sp.]|nr:MAG: hypothetical protein J3Q66DRAFT_410669 [Benniella sp.]